MSDHEALSVIKQRVDDLMAERDKYREIALAGKALIEKQNERIERLMELNRNMIDAVENVCITP